MWRYLTFIHSFIYLFLFTFQTWNAVKLMTAVPEPTLRPSLHRAHHPHDAMLDLDSMASRRRLQPPLQPVTLKATPPIIQAPVKPWRQCTVHFSCVTVRFQTHTPYIGNGYYNGAATSIYSIIAGTLSSWSHPWSVKTARCMWVVVMRRTLLPA